MSIKIRRDVLSIVDLSAEEVLHLCRRANQIKDEAIVPQSLRGLTVGVYFRKPSTRTRSAFTIGAGRLGATVMTFGPGDLQTTTGETLEDTARVLAGYLDILVMRTNESVAEMKEFARHPSLSVINALSSDEHPTQALADLATLHDVFGRLDSLDVLYCGEGNRTAAALALAMSRIPDTRLTLATPRGYGLDPGTLATAHALAKAHHAELAEIHDLAAAPLGVDVVYTSRWQEMGVEKHHPDWRAEFAPFRVTPDLMARVSKRDTVFLHDLPAVRGEDVDDEVLDGPCSRAWLQAQYKLFSAMSVIEWVGGAAFDDGTGSSRSPESTCN